MYPKRKQFPTGLPTNVAVAIPHTDAVHVIENAVCILKLKKKVLFNSMQDPNDTVNVDFVFNMSVVDDNKQLQMLQEIIKVVQDSSFLEKAKKCHCRILKTSCRNNGCKNKEGI